MSNLASSYSDLGRHEEALAMRERVLEFDRRVLPENHPDIGEGHVWSCVACVVPVVARCMYLPRCAGTATLNLAATYSALGRHEDALAMQERALEFRRRVLPENHPDVGERHVWGGVACAVFI